MQQSFQATVAQVMVQFFSKTTLEFMLINQLEYNSQILNASDNHVQVYDTNGTNNGMIIFPTT